MNNSFANGVPPRPLAPGRRRAQDKRKREQQVQRVRERLSESRPETHIDNANYHREQMLDLYNEIDRLWGLSESPESLDPAALREVAQRVETLGDLATFVGLTTTVPGITAAEQRARWETLRQALRRAVLKSIGMEP